MGMKLKGTACAVLWLGQERTFAVVVMGDLREKRMKVPGEEESRTEAVQNRAKLCDCEIVIVGGLLDLGL